MRLLLLAVLCAKLGASTAPGTLAIYKFDVANPLLDSSGNGHTLGATGTPVYSTAILCGLGSDQSAGPGAVANRLDTPSSLTSAMNGTVTWTVEGYFYVTNATAGGAIFGPTTGGNVGPLLYCAVGDNDVRWFDSTTDSLVCDECLAINTCYNFAITANGSNVFFYLDNTLSATVSQMNWPNRGFSFGSRPANADLPFSNGYVDSVRVSNVYRTNFPTVDLGSDGDCPQAWRWPCD